MLSDNRTILLAEIPFAGRGGFVWNRLHEEREDLCEALVKDADLEAKSNRELLQARLRTVDDALDRLMAGSYGICSKCGAPIDEVRLDLDPAQSFCANCRRRGPAATGAGAAEDPGSESAEELELSKLKKFDTIVLQTQNSEYRMLLLDPSAARCLIEGGEYLMEPSEALVRGAGIPGEFFKDGSICAGSRLELWIGERVFITSPVKTIQLRHNAAAEVLQTHLATVM